MFSGKCGLNESLNNASHFALGVFGTVNQMLTWSCVCRKTEVLVCGGKVRLL